MFDLTDTYSFIDKSVCTYQNVSPNLRTGEGRARCRPLSRHKTGDLKKKTHRKMAKKSRRANRK